MQDINAYRCTKHISSYKVITNIFAIKTKTIWFRVTRTVRILKVEKKFHNVTSNYHVAVTRIRTWDTSATTKGTNHYTTTAYRNYKNSIKKRATHYSCVYGTVVSHGVRKHLHALAAKHMMRRVLCISTTVQAWHIHSMYRFR